MPPFLVPPFPVPPFPVLPFPASLAAPGSGPPRWVTTAVIIPRRARNRATLTIASPLRDGPWVIITSGMESSAGQPSGATFR
ncbi:hypothetical protein DS843_18395 [Roseomonas genomospecies 6]|uniref:Uncharacterized protein n=1 Tax=Roseomonas genomospecies 6 TaxID=214106 RepID=A0A9W7TYB1_9PROT|nr:hypothetical protein DS843_18395 [Roseomonas genomospecies 6]